MGNCDVLPDTDCQTLLSREESLSWRTAASCLNPPWFLCTQALPIKSIFAKTPQRPGTQIPMYLKSMWKKVNCEELQTGEVSCGEAAA